MTGTFEAAGAGLRAVFVNGTLKRSPDRSNTDGLLGVARAILETASVVCDTIRAVDHAIPAGMAADMRGPSIAADDWPALHARILAADILVLGTPIWLGRPSSVIRRVVERLYAQSSELNADGQYAYYGRVGGCIVTGNEDGLKACAAELLYGLQHIGFLVPPQADAGWVGPAGPGPSYLDEGSGGPDNDFTQRGVTFLSWNLLHLARMLKAEGGVPAHGNQQPAWQAGARFGHPAGDRGHD
ncbi:MAG: flavodoxin family protein [Alphaproteobacteria bacterium]|nr:flavodoxin family protein [Alphaproteobacteria bacterium]